MKPQDVSEMGRNTALYQALLEQALAEGKNLMAMLIQSTRLALHDRESSTRNTRDLHVLMSARQQLNTYEPVLLERFPSLLQTEFLASEQGDSVQNLKAVNFDQLELMDESRLSECVELARLLQTVSLAVELNLSEFNPLISALAGRSAVRADLNPLRPEKYAQALHKVVLQMRLSDPARQDWLWHMGEALGKELNAFYAQLIDQLVTQGVQPVAFAMKPQSQDGGESPARGAAGGPPMCPGGNNGRLNPTNEFVGRSQSTAPKNESLLTLEKLRRLLSGELEVQERQQQPESFAQRFSREFEAINSAVEPEPSDFHATVPAAFEALQEMNQIDQIMLRIGSRNASKIEARPVAGQPLDQPVSGPTYSLGQALSLEVVALMVDNIANDDRLLAPIQKIIKNLEPAFMQLALTDVRFFSDKNHPAQRLLQELTHRSLAFDKVDAVGFSAFTQIVQRVTAPLLSQPIEDAQLFSHAFQALVHALEKPQPSAQLASAVQALEHAENRNLLAEKIAQRIDARPEAKWVAVGILDFLRGPWAQVMAQARLADLQEQDDPGRYGELVFALLWSVQPELTRKNIGKLTRLVPQLLGKLREGLDLIEYPSLKTSAFFELLMNLHQQAFKPATVVVEPSPPQGLLASLVSESDPWVAPAEVKASGFMELPVETTLPESAEEDGIEVNMPVGAWVELLVGNTWVRTQLSWASPHGTLFLFTTVHGKTQSMTKRSRDKLLLNGSLRQISGKPLVEGAFDAVVQIATHNSMDINP